MSDTQTLGEMFRSHRKALGLTLETLAEMVEMTAGALSHIESGRRLPDPRNAVRIASVLGIGDEDVLQALDLEHAQRRRSSAYDSPSRGRSDSRVAASMARPRSDATFSAMPIEALFGKPGAVSEDMTLHSAVGSSDARNLARWSDDASARFEAMDRLADTAAEAIRTLRGLVEDEDPMICREARRLLRELDVRLPEE